MGCSSSGQGYLAYIQKIREFKSLTTHNNYHLAQSPNFSLMNLSRATGKSLAKEYVGLNPTMII